jgi:hypothetical protein
MYQSFQLGTITTMTFAGAFVGAFVGSFVGLLVGAYGMQSYSSWLVHHEEYLSAE